MQYENTLPGFSEWFAPVPVHALCKPAEWCAVAVVWGSCAGKQYLHSLAVALLQVGGCSLCLAYLLLRLSNQVLPDLLPCLQCTAKRLLTQKAA